MNRPDCYILPNYLFSYDGLIFVFTHKHYVAIFISIVEQFQSVYQSEYSEQIILTTFILGDP